MTWNTRTPGRRRWPLVLGGVVVLIVVLVVASAIFAASHDTSPTAPSSPTAEAAPAGDGLNWGPVSWYSLSGASVPVSTEHGPRTNGGETASGFSHDPQGAVLAAVNVSTRSSGLVGGEAVFGPTIARQTTGDVERYLAATRETYTEITRRGGAPVPLIIGYRLAADNTADDVRFDVIGRMTNPTNPSLRALITGSLHVRWLDGDWKLVVPTGAGQQIKAMPGGFSPMPGQRLTLAG